jgi:hypothetical protein
MSWINVGHDVGLDVMAGCCGTSRVGASPQLFSYWGSTYNMPSLRGDEAGLREEPTAYYAPDDIRAYQSELMGRMNRIDNALRQGQSPRLLDWLKTVPQIQVFLKATPKSGSGAKLAYISLMNRSLWNVGKNAERIVETWEDIAATVPPVAGPGPVPGPGPSAPPYVAPWAAPYGSGLQKREKEEEKSSLPTWDEAKPFVYGGGALVGLGIVASILKSVLGK